MINVSPERDRAEMIFLNGRSGIAVLLNSASGAAECSWRKKERSRIGNSPHPLVGQPSVKRAAKTGVYQTNDDTALEEDRDQVPARIVYELAHK